MARELEPDSITLDLHMPQMAGMTALERLRAAGVLARVARRDQPGATHDRAA